MADYRAKRDFRATPEPSQSREAPHKRLSFVVQEHHATRLHYDFRLQCDGVLKSWAVTKEPNLDPAINRLAVRVEDHPLSYAGFQGTIPKGHYGAGEVEIWERGTYKPAGSERSLTTGIEAGKVTFKLHGRKLKGRVSLVRMRRNGRSTWENWLLIKSRDEYATPRREPATRHPVNAARKTRPEQPPQVNKRGAAPRDIEITNPDNCFIRTMELPNRMSRSITEASPRGYCLS